MFFKKKLNLEVCAPIKGSFLPQKDIQDETFSSGLMGPALGIYPDTNEVVSPIDGEITMVFPTGHALGIKRSDGLEILIHIGVDTVNLKGQGFKVLVKEHNKVKKGSRLVEFDKNLLLSKALDPTVIIVFTNFQEFDIRINSNQKSFEAKDVIGNAKRK